MEMNNVAILNCLYYHIYKNKQGSVIGEGGIRRMYPITDPLFILVNMII